ncbi:transposase [Desulfocapsa sulfexigens DSM 10523]|uniref:Transposase n=1 Tax=Desulfocapsa sulfexigens (strain DSM 10523 / SB164P1) TaxID=1167006 RepID=M1PAU2_DESSD|nr:IS1182 family transposase [Desulfocapsa sulfexigens]AGF78772.1 transposase [Desulfocapsa sulfexigens DSM 10523]
MAKYKPYNPAQGHFLPVFFNKQLQKGTFEYSINYLIDHEMDLSHLDSRYRNDENGAPAYDPRILLKVVLFAYSRGITSSREIAKCCEENVVFMALSAHSRPHFTTISNFISSMDKEVITLFREVLLVCDAMGLIGREMFAVDGCKLPSNASKEWSGTKKDFKRKCLKLENAIERIVKRHREADLTKPENRVKETEKQYVSTLKKQVKKIKEWMDDNDDKPGHNKTPTKSNITDNDSAKIKSSNGIIQGYNGVAMVDNRHQVIVGAAAYGEATEYNLLSPMIEITRKNFESIESDEDVFKTTKLTADSGFHTNKNMEMLAEEQIDAYIADRYFRKRDPRFDNAGRYKERTTEERRKIDHSRKQFLPKDFTFDPEFRYCVCPAGKRMYKSGFPLLRGVKRAAFTGQKKNCRPCKLRTQCLRYPERTEVRQVTCALGTVPTNTGASFADKMKSKIDSVIGKAIYAKRIATAEPPFAHIRHVMGLDRFSFRGKKKVNNQWLLFCVVHNLKKVHNYGMPGAT